LGGKVRGLGEEEGRAYHPHDGIVRVDKVGDVFHLAGTDASGEEEKRRRRKGKPVKGEGGRLVEGVEKRVCCLRPGRKSA
jgi:hypothetical protein